MYNIDLVNPQARRIVTSAKTGDGVDELRGWLTELASRRVRATV
jgi:hypothetical protein